MVRKKPPGDYSSGYAGLWASIRQNLFERICGFMGVNSTKLTFEFASAGDMAGAGEYHPDRLLIRVVDRALEEPLQLAATFAHELAHYILMTQSGRDLLENNRDMEWITDLTPTLFGLGIYAANATIFEKTENEGNWSRYTIRRLGYLPSRMFGYAMALQIWLSEETDIRWIKHLRGDASETLLKSLEYLDATGDSLLRRDNLHDRQPTLSIHQLQEKLKGGSPAEQVVAFEELAHRGEEAVPAVPILCNMLSNPSVAIRAEAARTLAAMGPAAEAAVPMLLHMTDDWTPEAAATAIYALGRLHGNPEIVIQHMLDLLDRTEVAETVAWTLSQYGQAAELALPKLETFLVDALARNAKSIDYFTHAVRAIASDPEREIEQVIASCDAELQPQARNLIPEHESLLPPPPGGRDWRFWLGGPV
jgi:hypothetical protein